MLSLSPLEYHITGPSYCNKVEPFGDSEVSLIKLGWLCDSNDFRTTAHESISNNSCDFLDREVELEEK